MAFNEDAETGDCSEQSDNKEDGDETGRTYHGVARRGASDGGMLQHVRQEGRRLSEVRRGALRVPEVVGNNPASGIASHGEMPDVSFLRLFACSSLRQIQEITTVVVRGHRPAGLGQYLSADVSHAEGDLFHA